MFNVVNNSNELEMQIGKLNKGKCIYKYRDTFSRHVSCPKISGIAQH